MKERIISAIFMLIIFIPLLILGSWPFYIMSLILGTIVTYELLHLNKKIPLFVKIITYILVSLIILHNVESKTFIVNFDLRSLSFLLLIYLSLLVFVNNQDKYNYKDAFSLIGTVLFVGIAFNNFIHIRNISIYLMIYLFLITTMTDTFAYFSGKFLGKHKLAPLISPNKTIEGAIGGSLIGTVIASLFYIFVIKDYTNIYLVILITFLLTIVGQLGDLIKSSIKRYANIKDFSNLIPGHGGVLDRLDSIIFVIMAYILISGLF